MDFLKEISKYAIAVIFTIILFSGLYNGVRVYDVFVEGAKEGANTIFRIVPSLVGLFVAIEVFKASGALDLIIHAVAPLTSLVGIPREVLPLVLLRPISGSASLAVVAGIIENYGPDSLIGRITSVMMGSTETIFYTLAIYFGSVGIKKIRYTLAVALIADAVSILLSVWICTLVFGN
ncbi:MAG TPA: spore maturation protein [Clostridiaceae bacterium]|nr:spore maturation protein [Clostridiaceae bacterium]